MWSTSSDETTGRGGFTLLEAVVACTLLSVGIFGVLAGLSGGMRADTRATRDRAAATFVQSKMEQTVATPMEDLHPDAGGGGGQTWKLDLTPLSGGLVRASISVAWSEQGQEDAFTLVQIFAPRHKENEGE
ncbi:MAG: hypothetical protein NT031_10820 [Planctomycetota bacterium]|nr:hypothetical protein [Planctomycetota bacterium]